MKPDANQIRDRVAASYRRALASAQTPVYSCCVSQPGTGSCGAMDAASPAGLEIPSFGCGDPLLFSNVRPGSTVLDLGSGAGYDLIAAAQRVGSQGRVIGVDMTDEMVEAARRNVRRAGFTNIEVRKGIIENLPVESSSIDWVISNCVINLSPEKDIVFAEIARVLKPGGRFSISDICASDLPDWIMSSSLAYDSCVAGAVSETAYVHGLRRAGLTELLVDSRIVYSMSELRTLAEEIAPDSVPGSELSDLEGRVWSVRFTGRKPY